MSVVEEAIIVRLITATQTKSIIQDRAFSGIIQPNEEETWLPAVSLELINDSPAYHAGGETGISEANILVTCWGKRQSDAKNLGEAVRAVLSGFRGRAGSADMRVFLDDGEDIAFESADNAELRAHGVQKTANVWYTHLIAVPF